MPHGGTRHYPVTVAERMAAPVPSTRDVAEQQGRPITFREAA